jgi:hypothetical protein
MKAETKGSLMALIVIVAVAAIAVLLYLNT